MIHDRVGCKGESGGIKSTETPRANLIQICENTRIELKAKNKQIKYKLKLVIG